MVRKIKEGIMTAVGVDIQHLSLWGPMESLLLLCLSENPSRPVPLKRGLNSQSLDGHLNKRSHTSSVSSLTSTYTWHPYFQLQCHYHFLQFHWRDLSALEEKGSQCLTLLQPCLILLTDSREASKETKRRGAFSSFWLFSSIGNRQGVPGRTDCRYNHIRGIPLILPPSPLLGYSITAEDLDLGKKASLQWLNKVLEDKTATTSGFGAMTQTTSSGASSSDLFLNDFESGFALETPVGGTTCAVLLPPAKSTSVFCPQPSASLAPKSLVARDC
ncbi:Nuclear envelope pore membrane protein POM 121C [Manis javanica]|nr:Nuclear envelope pore membrane protein POM 121C [Manis javanica]